METITLQGDLFCDALTIPSMAVSRMIEEANESQMKIYLYLLKEGRNCSISVSDLADHFNYSEQDVKRALRFWNTDVSEGENQRINGVDSSRSNVVAFTAKPSYTKEKIADFARQPEVSQLLFVAEQYIGRPLKVEEIHSILYMYDDYGFTCELIEYLLEYCISNNQKSFKQIEETACQWKESGIASVTDAKRFTGLVPKQMNEVLSAMGLDKTTHQPIEAEMAYVRKWTEIFGYDIDIVREACRRTVSATGKANFKYANSILKGWHDAGVRTFSDILASDEKFREAKVRSQEAVITRNKPEEKTARASKKTNTNMEGAASKSKFANFPERQYDYDALMRDILSN